MNKIIFTLLGIWALVAFTGCTDSKLATRVADATLAISALKYKDCVVYEDSFYGKVKSTVIEKKLFTDNSFEITLKPVTPIVLGDGGYQRFVLNSNKIEHHINIGVSIYLIDNKTCKDVD